MTNIWMLYSTYPNREEAFSAARSLLEARLVACANLVGEATSVYRWEGQVQESQEVVMVAKTTASCVDKAIEKLRELHSYDVPCITAWPIQKTHPAFSTWTDQETTA